MLGTAKKIYLYTRFERFNHWLQAALIITLLITGFEIHGTYTLLGFETAFHVHNYAAWAWLILFAFGVFWLLTTGEWKQYQPTFFKMVDVIRHYTVGIFKGEPHPVPKSERAKHNPLQRLTYLSLVSFMLPFQMITGFLYYYYNSWPQLGLDWPISVAALLHTLGAFLVLQFLVVHVYMTTTGHTLFCHIKAMCTGWEEIHEHPEAEEAK